ncbi:MAG: hypothetical protein HC853_09285 [Anaerolineae bacterium]|nr:hypothetical protein [Anaerolineae bacterium]
MYEAGAAPYFDLLGAHAPGFKAAPETSPDEVAKDPALGGHRFFCFAASRTCAPSCWNLAMARSKWQFWSLAGQPTPCTRTTPGSP